MKNFKEFNERKKEILEFIIPEYAVSSLINGDDSGINDEDIEKIDKFVEETVVEYGHANFSLPNDDELELGFRTSNDIDNLGNNCYKLLLLV